MLVWAQKAPDNDSLYRAIADGDSPYYYPNLYGRYMAGDTTLTLDDYRHLYYGFAWDENYRPLQSTKETDWILEAFSANREPDSLQCLQIMEHAGKVMLRDPFSPSNLNFMAYACHRIGDYEWERVNADRLEKVLAAIGATGTGLKEDSPWHIIMFSHAIDYLAAQGIEARKPVVVSRAVEYVPYMAENGRNKGYYFDYSRIYWKRPEVLPERPRSDGWQINGVKVK